MVEVTCKTVQGRFLLRPDPETRSAILGVLGRAQALYSMRIVAFSFLSNHYHLLLIADSPKQLARFMGHVNSNIAREVGRLHDWSTRMWSRRYESTLVSDEEKAQVRRLRYLLAQGVKEGLVARAIDWPGPSSVAALVGGEAIVGTWFDRTAARRAREKGIVCAPTAFSSDLTVELTPMPCWSEWTEARRQQATAELLLGIQAEAAAARGGRPVLGKEAILRQPPHHRSETEERTPAPRFHAASKAAWQLLRDAYRLFVAAFRRAAERLRGGDRQAPFPPGSFPSALPYVPIRAG